MRKILVGFAVLAAAACGGGQKKETVQPARTAAGNEDLNLPKVDNDLCETKGKKVSLYDLNQDGKPDVWKLYDEKAARNANAELMTCKQVDLNHDGKKDYVAQFDEAGNIIVEEYDFDFDGKFDARLYFDRKTGKKYAAERVSGFRNDPDVWEKFGPDEKLEALRRDRNGDGRPDYWEQYLGGSLDKVLYDDNYDGQVDRKEEAHPERDLGSQTGAAAAAEETNVPPDTKPAPAPATQPAAKPAPKPKK